VGFDSAESKGRRRGAAGRRRPNVAGVLAGGIAALWLLGPIDADAAHHHGRQHHLAAAPGVPSESILIDADSGRVMSQCNPDELTYPASLTKMMTLYLAFEAMRSGHLRLDQTFPVSSLAASQPPTKLGLTPGERVSVHDLILGMITRSANDAAIVMAEGLGGSEAAFARRMTEKARQLGMTRTVFVNANGLPDPGQHTTARDMARLALALYRDFPRQYHYFATREFEFRGQTVHSHNHLLDWYKGADGIKTGYIRASGFNLAASAVRDGHRLIGVVLGGPSVGTRDHEMAALLDHGFAEVEAHPVMVARSDPPLTPTAAPPPRREPSGRLGRVAARLAAHLAPVERAEAAPFRHVVRTPPAGERWCVQLGAFRHEAAAERIARKAAALPATRGKPLQILRPHKVARDHLYRARLLNFSKHEAQSTCAALHKRRIACRVVPATPVNYAASR
jgi:D-alanyl-D-alanine carboxypeptidase